MLQKKKVDPNYNLIRKLAEECRMPLCYGGGIKSIAQAEKIIGLGLKKSQLVRQQSITQICYQRFRKN